MCSVSSSETLVVLLRLSKKILITESTRFAGKPFEKKIFLKDWTCYVYGMGNQNIYII